HAPFIRMCVRRIRSPEKAIRRCLPRAATDSMVRPTRGRSSATRVSAGKVDSKRSTRAPASTRWSVSAARKMGSPSGTGFGPYHALHSAAKRRLQSHRAAVEAGLQKVVRRRMERRGLTVDLFDQHAARRIGARPRAFDEGPPDTARRLRALRLGVGQKEE